MASDKSNSALRWTVVLLLFVLFVRAVLFGLSAVKDGSNGSLALAGVFLVVQAALLLAAIGWARNRRS
jgi:hypothetical protein